MAWVGQYSTHRCPVVQLFAAILFASGILIFAINQHLSRISLTGRFRDSFPNFISNLQRILNLDTRRSAIDSIHNNPYDFTAPEGPWSRAFFLNENTTVLVLLRPTAMEKELEQVENVTCRLGDLDGRMIQVRRSHLTMGHSWDAVIIYCGFERYQLQQVTNSSGLQSNYSELHLPEANDTKAGLVYPKRPRERFKLTVCVPPVHGTIRFQWIKEWILIYEENIGVEHTFLYSYVADFRLRLRKIGIDERRTPFSILDMSTQDKMEYDQHYRGQMVTIYDCLFLNRYLETKWTIFQDLDEVIWLPPRWRSLVHLLSTKKIRNHYDAVSFGKWYCNITYCRTHNRLLSTFIDRMNVFRPQPFCGEMCPAWHGLRKYVVKPSRAEYLYIHRPNFETPSQLDRKIRDLKISEGFLRHYRSVADLDGHHYPFAFACSRISHRRTVQTASLPFEEFKNPRPKDNRTFIL